MSKTRRLRRGTGSHESNFTEKVRSCRWAPQSEEELAALLAVCVRNDGCIADAYGLLRELVRRKTGLLLFDSQLMAAYAMQQGRIAELPTGEGKTLAAVITAAVFALQGKRVHVLVFNDYLAQRDYKNQLPVYSACGLTCGYIVGASSPAHRKAAYACDVVYVPAKEAAFDYLRDFLCTEREQLLCQGFSVALVDEADSILIDEARVPLVLAGNAAAGCALPKSICEAVSALSREDYEVNRADRQVWLTDSGIARLEAALRLENLYLPENADILARVNAALEARLILQKDRDYIVRDGMVLVVDEATGRVAENRRFPDLLQQAVEMQELGMQHEAAVIYNTMSMRAFLAQYEVLCGMTGTAASSAAELRTLYGLEVTVVAPHIPSRRIDHPDLIFAGKEEYEAAILARVQSAHRKGQPVLIGTQSVQESEHFSGLLARCGIRHCILNARNDAEEAGIIADAGRPYRVTISTNMAGRGVDIRLGGGAGEEAGFVRAAGGLLVIGTGINRSLRIDNQLRGRAGRQGDPGESQFFVCLDTLQAEIPFDAGFYSPKRYPNLLRRAQRIREGRDAEARYMLERYSQLPEAYRKKITRYRTELLLDARPPQILRRDEPAVYKKLTDRYGVRGVTIAEKQLTLYFINIHWAAYLSALEDKRDGIHLVVVGGKNPLDEYRMFAASAFHEMAEDIRSDVAVYMQKCTITEEGIDMEEAGLTDAAATWTYLLDDSASQFSSIPRLVRNMSSTIRGTVFTLRGLAEKARRKLCGPFRPHS